MNQIVIENEEIIALAKESLPKLLQETFSRTYSNPLSDVMDKILKSDEFKAELEKIVLEVYREVSQEVDFKSFVREAVVHSVIKELEKRK